MKVVTVSRGGRTAEVAVTKKNIRNVHLRVSPSGKVALSVPFGTGEDWIDRFLAGRAEWIFHAQDKYGVADEPGFVCVLGKLRRLVLIGGRGPAELGEETLTVRVPENGDPEKRVAAALGELARADFAGRLAFRYPCVARCGAGKPTLAVRRMTSVWGTCNRESGVIRLNSNLFAADPDCVDYVVRHELTHLLYGGHGADFKAFLTACMPDWQTRRARLNRLYAKYLRNH